jgi:hypothetical protein
MNADIDCFDIVVHGQTVMPRSMMHSTQGCQIFLDTTYQNGKIYEMTNTYTRGPLNIPKWP